MAGCREMKELTDMPMYPGDVRLEGTTIGRRQKVCLGKAPHNNREHADDTVVTHRHSTRKRSIARRRLGLLR